MPLIAVREMPLAEPPAAANVRFGGKADMG
jgi:hypothetical protein